MKFILECRFLCAQVFDRVGDSFDGVFKVFSDIGCLKTETRHRSQSGAGSPLIWCLIFKQIFSVCKPRVLIIIRIQLF